MHLSPKIIKEIARCNLAHRIEIYCEPCAGGARVLLNKAPHLREILNDKNHSLMALWAVVKHPIGHKELVEKLKLYPHSKTFFDEVKQKMDEYEKGELHLDTLTVAANMYLLAHQSRVAALKSFKQYKHAHRNNREKSDFYLGLKNIYSVHHRVKNVELRQGDYITLMRELEAKDVPTALCSIDPPYWKTCSYNHNLSCEEHEELVEFLSLPENKNKYILSGYDNSAYQRLVDELGWTKIFVGNIAVPSSVHNGKCRRAEEFIWMNF